MSIARLASLALFLAALAAAPAAAQDAAVTVTFADPEKYADLRLSCVSRDTDVRRLMGDLERYLVPTAPPLLAPGQRLQITLTSVDMAGDIEDRRGPGRCDVRIMKDPYPPRIDPRFRRLDAAGRELQAGDRKLGDSNYLVNAGPASSTEHLRDEKALPGDWLRTERRGARA